mgnify:FL=1
MVARLLFLDIINNGHSTDFDILHMLENANGIAKLENTPKLELYYIKRDALKHRAATGYPLCLDNFLMSNSNHFNSQLINEILILKEIIQFKGELKILLALNKEYQFEKNKAVPIVENMGTSSRKPSYIPPTNKMDKSTTMPTDEEMDAYLMKHVFSRKT